MIKRFKRLVNGAGDMIFEGVTYSLPLLAGQRVYVQSNGDIIPLFPEFSALSSHLSECRKEAN